MFSIINAYSNVRNIFNGPVHISPDHFAETINSSALEQNCQFSPSTREDLWCVLRLNVMRLKPFPHTAGTQKYSVDVAGSLDDPKIMIGIAPQTFGDERFDDGYIVEFSQPLPWPGCYLCEKSCCGSSRCLVRATLHRANRTCQRCTTSSRAVAVSSSTSQH